MPMAKRHSIKFTEETYQKILSFCNENNITTSAFLEERIRDYFDEINHRPAQANWAKNEFWVLSVLYGGDQNVPLNDQVQISIGRRGAECDGGLSFVFDSKGTDNSLVARSCKKRVLQDVNGIDAEAFRYRIDHGMD